MKEKIITIILTVIAILAPLLIIPENIYPNYNILKLVILLISGIVLLIMLLLSYKTLEIDNKDVLLLLFLGLIIISTFLSSNVSKSIIGENDRYEGLLMYVIYACIYFCSKKYFKYNKLTNFLNIMFYISCIIGILGILQRNINCIELYPIFNKGICSTFGNSNFFGSYISLILPISLSVYIIYGNKKGFILSILMFFNMISSGTRSSWVAFLILVLIYILYLVHKNNKDYLKRTLVIFFIFVLIFIYLFSGLNIFHKTTNNINYTETKVSKIISDIKTLQDTGINNKMGSNRIEIWNMTLKLIFKKPIFGCGTDNLKNGLFENCKGEILKYNIRTQRVPDKAHNEYLHIAATIGIPALVIYLIFLILIIKPKIKLIFKDNMYYIIILVILSYMTQAFFNISTIGIAPLFWMILGLSDNKNIY